MIQLLENSFVESAKTPPNSQMNITLRKVFNTGGTTTQWDRRSTTGGQSRPPETCLDWTAAPSKVSHTRDANAGLSWQIQTPSQRLKYVWKPGATNTKLRQNQPAKDGVIQNLFLGGGKSSDTRRGSFWKESFVLDITANDMCVHMQINLVLPWLSHTTDFSFHILPPLPPLSVESHSLWLTTSPFFHNFSTLPSFYNFAQVLRQYGSVVVILPVAVMILIHDT